MRLLLVGEAPGRFGAPEPLAGKAGRFLAKLANLPMDEFLAHTERVNLLPHWPGPGGAEGSAFPIHPARKAAITLGPRILQRRVLVLGRVGDAFGMTSPWYEWVPLYGGQVARFPHPSGLNRRWNDPNERAFAGEFLGAAIRLAEYEGREMVE